MMRPRRRMCLLVIVGAIPVIAAAQLNPTVKVLTRPKSAVPAECDEGLAAQQARRLTTEERTAVSDTSRDLQAPPTASLRTSLEAAVVAAQHSSRQAFRDALTQSKSLLVSYPPGGERTAASNLVDVLDDVDRIWEYEFTSPTGAFFDSSSEPFRIASKYPGYESAIRRQIITDQNGNKFYPTHETRDFLIAESGQRLPRVTGKPAPPPRPAPRAAVTPVAPSPERTTKPKPQHTMKQTTTKSATTHTTTHATTHATRPSHRRATHKPVVQEAHTAPSHPKPVQTTPPPKPMSELAPTHPPIVSETAAKTPPPTTSSSSTATSDSATSTTATTIAPTETSTTTATTESSPAAKPAQSRSLLGPILLIIVGIGLLLTLWRASS